jgi:hypothetical protein
MRRDPSTVARRAAAVAARIEAVHDEALRDWYGGAVTAPPHDELEALVLEQHRSNFELWGLEDEARRRDVDDSIIAATKRAIDTMNQTRNDLIERVDDLVLAEYGDVDVRAAELHSETAGQMIDRLSILALKIRNLGVIASDDSDRQLAAECAAKVAILEAQRRDLAGCLRRLLDDFAAGRRCFRSYRQFKAYNDPRLNPALAARKN